MQAALPLVGQLVATGAAALIALVAASALQVAIAPSSAQLKMHNSGGRGVEAIDGGGDAHIIVKRANGRTTRHALRALPTPRCAATALGDAGRDARGTGTGTVGLTPTYAGIKFVAAYLAEDVDPHTQNNIGNNSMIWINPQCPNGEIGNCGVEAARTDAPSGYDASQYVQISDFFDLTQSTAAVNAALNSQQRRITPGTYRYVRLEKCRVAPGGQEAEPNMSFQAGDMGAPFAFANASCGDTSAIVPPLVLGPGDSVTVSLAYSVENSVYLGSGGAAHDNCASGDPQYCWAPPQFVPSAA